MKRAGINASVGRRTNRINHRRVENAREDCAAMRMLPRLGAPVLSFRVVVVCRERSGVKVEVANFTVKNIAKMCKLMFPFSNQRALNIEGATESLRSPASLQR